VEAKIHRGGRQMRVPPQSIRENSKSVFITAGNSHLFRRKQKKHHRE
jgi:hypothetical protein